MAFSPTRFGFGAAIANRRQNDRILEAEAAQAEADRRQKEAETLRTQRDELVEGTLAQYDEIVTAASDAAKTGRVSDEQIEQMKQAGEMVLASTMTTLMQDRAMLIASGRPEAQAAAQNIERIAQSLVNQTAVFDARVAAARGEASTPEQRGQELAAEQMAQAKALADDLEIPVEEAAEALGLVPGKPSPTNLELIERQIMTLREAGVPEDDPRIVARLGQIAKMSTGSVGSMVVRLLEKKLDGSITPLEEEVLRDAQQMSFLEQLMFNSMGGFGAGGGSGTPRLRVTDDGELVTAGE